MKVLFTHSYFLKFDIKQYKTAMPYPPLGTLYAMAYLREKGYDVKLFDTMFCDSSKDIQSTIDAFKPDIFISYDDGFNYLTKMCLTNMREACFEMQTYAKSKGCKVITSSSDAADHYESYLNNGADVIAIGEAEQTVLELCNAFKTGTSIDPISGIAYLKNTAVEKSKKRDVLKDLDTLPAPAWDLIDIAPYKKMWLEKHGYFSLNFVTTRGCPYKCNWCAKPIYGNRYNTHSPENISKEIKKWQLQFGFTHVWFADDIFGLKPSWVIEFSEAVKKENLKIAYKIQSRADLLVEPKYIEALADSGCTEVWMGAESGSQKILDAMDKGTKVEQIYEASALLKKFKIRVCLFLQLGYLNETIDDIKLTVKMIGDLLPDDIGISVSYPLPGTKFYELVKKDLKEKTNWSDSDEMALMFQNTYSAEFYKQLHHFIHKLYRQKKAEKRIKSLSSINGLKKLAAWPFYRAATQRSLSKLKETEPNVNIVF
ncbi:B12-binding domain-containing radical SAM protein [Aurantibacillus circumpalustris]|uniref:B12-binding domain-containing radical SAM protein n=1 Tax=Aurantibacillus circumpalustris TaxID=3036359 RepID=UPI00295A5E16|nr:radical SAM protein [Aurantibacillus circumpalustris]